MYKIKNGYLYFISEELNKTYILNCITKDVMELDDVGTELIKELLISNDLVRLEEIISLFEGVDLFEKRSA